MNNGVAYALRTIGTMLYFLSLIQITDCAALFSGAVHQSLRYRFITTCFAKLATSVLYTSFYSSTNRTSNYWQLVRNTCCKITTRL